MANKIKRKQVLYNSLHILIFKGLNVYAFGYLRFLFDIINVFFSIRLH